MLREEAGVLEIHGLDVEGEAAVADGPALRHVLLGRSYCRA